MLPGPVGPDPKARGGPARAILRLSLNKGGHGGIEARAYT